jgi:hypothetical protein
MSTAAFYREEADRCQRRAAAARNPGRARRWHDLADEYLRLALMMEDAEAESPQLSMRVPMQQQELQQPQSKLTPKRKI